MKTAINTTYAAQLETISAHNDFGLIVVATVLYVIHQYVRSGELDKATEHHKTLKVWTNMVRNTVALSEEARSKVQVLDERFGFEEGLVYWIEDILNELVQHIEERH